MSSCVCVAVASGRVKPPMPIFYARPPVSDVVDCALGFLFLGLFAAGLRGVFEGVGEHFG